jgi:hypothetical protein
VLGDGAFFIVFGWFVLNVTGSEFALGTTLTFAFIPRIIVMLVGGAVLGGYDDEAIEYCSCFLQRIEIYMINIIRTLILNFNNFRIDNRLVMFYNNDVIDYLVVLT